MSSSLVSSALVALSVVLLLLCMALQGDAAVQEYGNNEEMFDLVRAAGMLKRSNWDPYGMDSLGSGGNIVSVPRGFRGMRGKRALKGLRGKRAQQTASFGDLYDFVE